MGSTTSERGITKNEIISTLTKSPHGKLGEYVAVGHVGAEQESEFFAHLIAWNAIKGQVRDSKVALPVISLGVRTYPEVLVENSLAHMAALDPRNLVRAYRFSMEAKVPGRMRTVRRLVERYLRSTERDTRVFDRVAVQHRGSLRELYGLAHVKPVERADQIIFKGIYPRGSVFEAIAGLRFMAPRELAGTILERRIPFLIAAGAAGAKLKDPDVVLALIERMSPTELVTNTKMLEKLGVKTVPALRAAYEEGLQRASKGKANTLKASRAAEAMEDEGLREKLQGLQERQIASHAGIDGNWLVLADKSGSMSRAMEIGRVVASTLAKFVKGRVHLVFFDDNPRYIDATGKEYERLRAETGLINASGRTSIGCGLEYAVLKKFELDGIAIVSDGGENRHPVFGNALKLYEKAFEKIPPVYFYKVSPGDRDTLTPNMAALGLDMTTFDMTGVDFYSLPNIVQTMRGNKFSLVDEIMETPLLGLDAVLGAEKGVLVNA